jgi:hypothetical protein
MSRRNRSCLSRGATSILAAWLCASCVASEARVCAFDGAQTPMDVDLEVSRCSESVLVFEDAACASDADCVLIDPSIVCPRSQFGRCARAVAESSLDAFEDAASEAAAVVCAEAPEGLVASAACPSVSARCVDARCASEPDL